MIANYVNHTPSMLGPQNLTYSVGITIILYTINKFISTCCIERKNHFYPMYLYLVSKGRQIMYLMTIMPYMYKN